MQESGLEYIECRFSPQWQYISAARSFIQSFLGTRLNDQTRADKAAMATSELLENAIKYSPESETTLKVCVNSENNSVLVQVKNTGTPEECAKLESAFERACQKEPLEAYMEHMKHASSNNGNNSGLGLVRIRYEADADIRLEISKDHVITVSASL